MRGPPPSKREITRPLREPAGPEPAYRDLLRRRLRSESVPKGLSDQVQAVRAALEEQSGLVVAEDLARRFKRAPRSRVTEILEALSALGQARSDDKGGYADRR